MPILHCYVDDETLSRLKQASEKDGRTVEELAEAAISNEAVMATRDLPKAGWPLPLKGVSNAS